MSIYGGIVSIIPWGIATLAPADILTAITT